MALRDEFKQFLGSLMAGEKMLFAGGCHVVGHPVGPEYSFPRIAVRELTAAGRAVQIHCLPHVPLHHPETVERACREFSPNVLILQVGNYELTRDLRSYFRSLRGRPRPKSGSSALPGPVRRVGRFRFLLEARVKQAIDCAMGHRLVDLAAFGEKLDRFLAVTAHCSGAHVIVLSATPCADPTQRFYRLRARPIMEAAAARHGCDFVDILQIAPDRVTDGLGPDCFFADPAHLGIPGQLALGQSMAKYLRKVTHDAAISA